MRTLADFEEDIDVGTGSVPGVTLTGRGLASWRELGLTMRSGGKQPYENHAVRVGWTAPAPNARAAAYEMRLDDSAAARAGFTRGASLVFEVLGESVKPKALAPSDTAPATGPMPPTGWWATVRHWFARDTTAMADSAATGKTAGARGAGSKPDARADSAAKGDSLKPIDFRVELETAAGARASLRVGELEALPPPLTIRLFKWAGIEKRMRDGAAEVDQVLTRYVVPLDLFAARAADFDFSAIRVVRFVFDQTATGSVLLDNIGVEPRTP